MNYLSPHAFATRSSAKTTPRTEISMDASTDLIQNRHNDYNYDTLPAVRKCLEKYPLKQIIFNWNSLSLELKATADALEFESMLKRYYLSKYSSEIDCPHDCYSCNA